MCHAVKQLWTDKSSFGEWHIPISVTRFGEISPLWQKFTSLWQFLDSLFLIWQNAEPTLVNFGHYWSYFHCCKRPIMEK